MKAQHPEDGPDPLPRPESDAEESFEPFLLEAAEALDPSVSAAMPSRDGGGKLAPGPDRIPLAAGTLIAGRYWLDQWLGEGECTPHHAARVMWRWQGPRRRS